MLPEGFIDETRFARRKGQSAGQLGKRCRRTDHHHAGNDEGDGGGHSRPTCRFAHEHIDAGTDGHAKPVKYDHRQGKRTSQG